MATAPCPNTRRRTGACASPPGSPTSSRADSSSGCPSTSGTSTRSRGERARGAAPAARRAGRALIGLGLAPGQHVAILGFNRAEWVITYLGAMVAGGAAAGIYTTSSADEVAYMMGHAEAPVVVVE